MWWKIVLGVLALVMAWLVGLVVKMAITEAKEETRDIEEANEK